MEKITMSRFIVLAAYVYLSGLPVANANAEADAASPVKSNNTDGAKQEVVVLAESYTFSPDKISVKAGIPVQLKIKKKGFTPHDFVIDDPASGLSIKQKLSSSEYAIIEFTPATKGEFTFYCSKKMLFSKSHRDKGMQGILIVQ